MACSLEKLTVTEDLGRRPRYARRARVHAVADELAAATDVVDGVLEHLAASAGLDDYGNLLARSMRGHRIRERTDVESVRVVLLELLPLRSGVGPRERDVEVRGVEALRELHLGACCQAAYRHPAVRTRSAGAYARRH